MIWNLPLFPQGAITAPNSPAGGFSQPDHTSSAGWGFLSWVKNLVTGRFAVWFGSRRGRPVARVLVDHPRQIFLEADDRLTSMINETLDQREAERARLVGIIQKFEEEC